MNDVIVHNHNGQRWIDSLARSLALLTLFFCCRYLFDAYVLCALLGGCVCFWLGLLLLRVPYCFHTCGHPKAIYIHFGRRTKKKLISRGWSSSAFQRLDRGELEWGGIWGEWIGYMGSVGAGEGRGEKKKRRKAKMDGCNWKRKTASAVVERGEVK